MSTYITKEATSETARILANLAPGSIAMTSMVPFELIDDADRTGLEAAARGGEGLLVART